MQPCAVSGAAGSERRSGQVPFAAGLLEQQDGGVADDPVDHRGRPWSHRRAADVLRGQRDARFDLQAGGRVVRSTGVREWGGHVGDQQQPGRDGDEEHAAMRHLNPSTATGGEDGGVVRMAGWGWGGWHHPR